MAHDTIIESSCPEVIINDEAVPVIKRTARVSYPAISYSGSEHMYMNVQAAKLFNARNVRILTTPKYIIFIPTDAQQYDTFKIRPERSGHSMSMRVPAALRGKCLNNGVYKLYRCKYGYCIKRKEPEFYKEV